MQSDFQIRPKRMFSSAPASLKTLRIPSVVIVTIMFAIGLIILLSNAAILFRNMEVLRGHEALVKHTQEVLDTLELTLSTFKDAETGERGFIISGEESYLEPYNSAKQTILGYIAQVRQLTADDADQQRRIEELRNKSEEMFARYEVVITARRQGGIDFATKEVLSGKGKAMMDGIRELTGVMGQMESKKLQQRSVDAAASSISVDRSMVIQTLAIVVILGLAYYFVRRNLVQQISERLRVQRENWLKSGLAELNEILRGNQSVEAICKKTLAFFATYVGAPVGVFYINRGSHLELSGAYSGSDDVHTRRRLEVGEGITGEAVAGKRIIQLTDLPDSYLKVSSALGYTPIRHIVAVPILLESEVKGVMELGGLEGFRDLHFELFEYVRDGLGITIEAAQGRARTQDLLEETQRQTEELQMQQEELRTNNEELESQSVALKKSQESMQLQQEELRQTNEELEQQARILEAQKTDLRGKNLSLSLAQKEVEAKAAELELASRYKSEFLANMSHELRTPLNSLLILATLLSENSEGNLNDKQIDFAKTIHRAGTDLLNLISDILDLSKVEAGKLEVNVESMSLEQMRIGLEQVFSPMAERKGLQFSTHIGKEVPPTIRSDRQRLEQILKNFLSNAIKFTESGEVRLGIETAKWLNKNNLTVEGVRIDVTDTGIGIPRDKQGMIFEAFQQGDGSTSRKYGGTGLGLTISRELAQLLESRIEVASEIDVGSTFTLFVPFSIVGDQTASMSEALPPRSTPNLGNGRDDRTENEGIRTDSEASADKAPKRPPVIEGDIGNISEGDRVIVIIEDDVDFRKLLLTQAHEAGFKALIVSNGEAGIELIGKQPVHGVLLDLRLPDVNGLSILERLKANPRTRHLPVHVISGLDYSKSALQMGAVGYLQKPVSRDQLQGAFSRIEGTLSKQIKRVLIIEDDAIQRHAMRELLGDGDIEIDAVGLGREAIAKLEETEYDCMILDLRLPDVSGFELLEMLDHRTGANKPPVIIYTGKELSKEELVKLRRYSESIIIKGVKSPERLLDEVSLFLHRVEADLPPNKQALLQSLRGKESIFEGRKILLVDDDMRNVFALANALDMRGMKVAVGKNGKEAIEALDRQPDIDLVLMDIMMPLMDGYEAMRLIRRDSRFSKLPIIALTAKAMKGDQEKCLAAGANDYVPKPVDLEKLLSLIRVWLPRRTEI